MIYEKSIPEHPPGRLVTILVNRYTFLINHLQDLKGELMVDLKQIQYFIVCVEKESFSNAAEQLFTTQPNVSKAIKALEDEMGFRLFDRHARGICLTEDGKLLYQYAKNLDENLQKIEQLKRK